MKQKCQKNYAKFQIYKLTNFIEAYAGIRINKVQVDFHVAEQGIQIMSMDYLDHCVVENRENKTNYLKKVRVFEKQKQKEIMAELEEHRKILVQEKGQVDHKINFMEDFYCSIKNNLEIDLDYKTPEDHASQQIFEQINPGNKNMAIHQYIE